MCRDRIPEQNSYGFDRRAEMRGGSFLPKFGMREQKAHHEHQFKVKAIYGKAESIEGKNRAQARREFRRILGPEPPLQIPGAQSSGPP